MIAPVALAVRRPLDLRVAWPALPALLAAAVGVAVVFAPTFAFVAVSGLIVGAFLLVSPRVRFSFVVFGGLLTLQSSQSFSLIKFVYLIGVGGAVVGALLALRESGATSVRADMRPLFRISFGLLALAFVSLVQAFANGTPPVAWLRDAAPYILLAAVPLLATDVAARASRVWVMRTFVAAGTLACLSFSVAWLARRHLAPLPIDRFLFPSAGLAIAFVCYAFAKTQQSSPGRKRWAAATGLLLGLLLVTGTRTNLLVLVAPVAMAIANRQNPGRVVRFFGQIGVAIGLTLVAWTLLGKIGHIDLSRATDRLTSVTRVSSDPLAAQSLVQRTTQTRLAWHTFSGAPFDGVGPGHLFVWSDQFGRVHSGFSMDTSLLFLAKFGLLGVALLGFALYWGKAFIRNLPTRRANESARLALIGYLAFCLVSLPLGLPLEDKGFGLALIFLLALVILERRVTEPQTA